jgi:hypothetical protein
MKNRILIGALLLLAALDAAYTLFWSALSVEANPLAIPLLVPRLLAVAVLSRLNLRGFLVLATGVYAALGAWNTVGFIMVFNIVFA